METPVQSSGYSITTDRDRFDIDAIHEFLSKHAYWCLGIPKRTVASAVKNSVSAGAFHGARQVGFARVVTDKATFAWLCDVYVLPEHRGKGLARRMLDVLRAHPDLRGLRRWVLATRDAHDLYRRIGFVELPNPDRWMVIEDRDVYAKKAEADV
jgi:GNAT superfamily N-acetyltransferase